MDEYDSGGGRSADKGTGAEDEGSTAPLPEKWHDWTPEIHLVVCLPRRSNAVHNNLIQAYKGQICGVAASSASVSRLQSQSQNLGSRWTQMKKDGLFLVLCIWTRYNNY
ncbi:hypothetical protein NC652_017717 [Populus alba x Populus x berolinensis]|nr:hypothetical protein NC652_017717 [Populus alba x Populus x berolinensis]